MKPFRRPRVAPAMIAMAETGLKSGTAANRIHPGSRRGGEHKRGHNLPQRRTTPPRTPAKNKASTTVTTSNMSSAVWAKPATRANPIASGTAGEEHDLEQGSSGMAASPSGDAAARCFSSSNLMYITAGRRCCCGRTRRQAPCRQPRRQTAARRCWQGPRDELQVVRRHNDGVAPPRAFLLEHLPRPPAASRAVEPLGGLIEQQQARPSQEHLAQGKQLTLTARQIIRMRRAARSARPSLESMASSLLRPVGSQTLDHSISSS